MRNKILLFGLATLILLLVDILSGPEYCSFSCPKNYDGLVFNWLVVTGGVFVLLSILYFLPRSIFKSWWKFARIAIPIIFIISTIINLQFHHRSGGLFNMDNLFDLPILFLMYGVFIVGSLWQIWKGYKNS